MALEVQKQEDGEQLFFMPTSLFCCNTFEVPIQISLYEREVSNTFWSLNRILRLILCVVQYVAVIKEGGPQLFRLLMSRFLSFIIDNCRFTHTHTQHTSPLTMIRMGRFENPF